MQFTCFDAIIDIRISAPFSAALNILRFWLLLNHFFLSYMQTATLRRSSKYLYDKIRLESLFSIRFSASIFVLEVAVMNLTAILFIRCIIKGVTLMVFNVGKYSISWEGWFLLA